jgi:hypothetical protein
MRKLTLILAPIVIGAVLIIVVILNINLNPLVYKTSYMQNVANTLQAGKNYSIYDPNINWRALRREQIKLLKTTPQVIVSGGSRWQEASSDLISNKTFFNAHAHSDYNEDFFAIVELLESNKRMPETLILSLRYRIFEPIELRQHTGWREWIPEYRSIAERIGVDPHPLLSTTRIDHWVALLSLNDLMAQIKLRLSIKETPKSVDSYTTPTLDVIGFDGSLRWSEKNTKRFTPNYAEKDAQKRLKRFVDFDLEIDQKMVADVDKLLAYLKNKGVNVVFAQTPFHPTFYDGVQGTNFGHTLDKIELIGKAYAEKYNLQKVGSFNPHTLECSKEEFIDWHHGTPECLAKVFNQIDFSE